MCWNHSNAWIVIEMQSEQEGSCFCQEPSSFFHFTWTAPPPVARPHISHMRHGHLFFWFCRWTPKSACTRQQPRWSSACRHAGRHWASWWTSFTAVQACFLCHLQSEVKWDLCNTTIPHSNLCSENLRHWDQQSSSASLSETVCHPPVWISCPSREIHETSFWQCWWTFWLNPKLTRNV